MNWKQGLALVAVAAVVVSVIVAALVVREARRFGEGLGKPYVLTGQAARAEFQFPSSATDLYYAREGFGDTRVFVALTAPRAQIARVLDAYGVTLDALRAGPAIPERVSLSGPDSWGRAVAGDLWDVSLCPAPLVYESERLDVICWKDRGRVYVCDWGS